MDITSALDWLDSFTNLEGSPTGNVRKPSAPLPTAGAVDGLSLEPMRALLSTLGDPHQAYRSIHVTGTNGKGSTTRFIAGMLGVMGLSVGTYTSPNISRINERIGWGGRLIEDEEFAAILTLLREVVPLLSDRPSRFELLTAAAFLWFAEVGADLAVIEVGLLGRFDATNVIDSDVAVITNIAKDHTDGRPGWEREIAWEKAGIIRAGRPVVLGSPMGELQSIFDEEAPGALYHAGQEFQIEQNLIAVGGRSLDIVTPFGRHEEIHLPFHGRHQGDNLATAVMAVEALMDRGIDSEIIIEALEQVELPGRFEVVNRAPTVILDGGHNPDGVAAVSRTLGEEFARFGSWVLVFGMLAGKDPREMLEAVGAAEFDAVILTQPKWTRALPVDDLAAAARSMGLVVEVVPDSIEAYQRARVATADEDLIVVTGSMYVIGEIRSAAIADASV